MVAQTTQSKTPPRTDEGWFVLHEFYRVDWTQWQDLSQHQREQYLESGVEFFTQAEAIDDDDGASAVCAILGHESDLLVLHLRPTLDALSALERQFEQTPLARITKRVHSYVAVTEISDYVSDAYFEADEKTASKGIQRYLDAKLTPTLPDNEYICFYPMDRRRGETVNWYTEPYETRAAMMTEHGRTGKDYAGAVSQIVTNATGLDDHEWGVTLFADDPTAIKDIVYEMRFDEASARYSDFPSFRIGRRFPPTDLPAFFQGEPVPTDRTAEQSVSNASATDNHTGDDESPTPREELQDAGVYAGTPPQEDLHAVMVYSTASTQSLFEAMTALRSDFDRYETHIQTTLYRARDDGPQVVVSLWETDSAAETAAGFLTDLPEVEGRPTEQSGFGTMGMFYTVRPEQRETFIEAFDEVKTALETHEGHQQSHLLINHETETEMFIDSRWASRGDAMAFFNSDRFREAVSHGRELLADQPQHVFLE